MILFLIGLSTFSVGLSHATSCHSLQQSQLASLNERMNQMISALYPSAFPKAKVGSYQSSTPAPPTEYTTAPPYEPCYQGYQQLSQPNVVYMSQPNSPTTVAFSPPAPGSPPTVTISTTRTPCCQYDTPEYPYGPKYPPQYYDYQYPQYPPPYQAPPPAYTPPECPCQQEYQSAQAPCPNSQYPAQNPPAQPEYSQAPPPPCSPPPPYTPYPQPPNYPPTAYPPPPASPPYPAPPTYSYPPAPYSYGPPTYPQSPQYPPAPVYTNPRDAMLRPPQYQ